MVKQAASSSLPVEITTSTHFLDWLREQGISIAFTTYQTNRLFFLGLKEGGALSSHERLFDRPMGLCVDGKKLYVSTRYQLWEMSNILENGEIRDGYDCLYVPRSCHVTGELDVHDLAVSEEKELFYVNTQFSCLARISQRFSFTPHWIPPFITELAPQDKCHLNGLAMGNGRPRYMTAVSRSDVPAGWRMRREDGGCLLDIERDEVVLTGLSMPHSPRMYREKLWLLNSGRGEFGFVDFEKRIFEPVVFCPGFLRGLAFHGDFAIVGLSKPRHDKTFTGLPLDGLLEEKDAEPICGLMVVDLRNNTIVHWVELGGVVVELYDVAVIPDAMRPMAIGFRSDEVARTITYEQEGEVKFHLLPHSEKNIEQPLDGAPLPAAARSLAQRRETPVTSDSQLPTPVQYDRSRHKDYRFQVTFDLMVGAATDQFQALTFPDVEAMAQSRKINEPLIATVALHQEQPIGMAIAEISDNRAWLISLFVSHSHRCKAIGSHLVHSLEKAVAKVGYPQLFVQCSSSWDDISVMNRILQTLQWDALSQFSDVNNGVFCYVSKKKSPLRKPESI